jgi:hypothetical protein
MPAAVGSERAGSNDERVEALGADIAALRADMARLEHQTAGATRRVEVPALPEREQAAKARNGAPRPQLTGKELADSYTAYLQAERVDTSWSSHQESAIAAAFRGDWLKGSTLGRVDCRTSLCRMEVDHDSGEAEERFAQAVPMTPPFDQGGFSQRVTDDRGTHTIAFILREGHELPRVE